MVAAFDVFESLRSRKVMVLLTLYFAGAAAAAGLFVTLLRELENTVARSLAVGTTDRPGVMTEELMRSEQLREVLLGLVGDASLVDALIAVPPLALFYGWLALTAVPVLIVFTSGDAIAGDLGSGSCRFALFRTDRLSWAVGKLLGQAALMGVGVLTGALAVWAVGFGFMARFEALDTAWWLLRLGGRAWVHGFAWLGGVMAVSQLTRSNMRATGGSLMFLMGVGVIGLVLQSPWAVEYAPVLSETLFQLVPRAHRLDLWRPTFAERLPGMVMLLALGVSWFALGHIRFARRDA